MLYPPIEFGGGEQIADNEVFSAKRKEAVLKRMLADSRAFSDLGVSLLIELSELAERTRTVLPNAGARRRRHLGQPRRPQAASRPQPSKFWLNQSTR